MLIGGLISLAIYLVLIPLVIPNVNDIIREFVQTLFTLQTAQFYLFIAFSVTAL